MAPINCISPVHICTDGVSLTLVVAKYVCLMSACMSPQYGVFIQIIGIGTASTGMVFRKAQGVKVLGYADNWVQVVVVCVYWRREVRFNDLACYRDWMRRL